MTTVGYIFSRDGKAGFLANLEEPFSPDGYYTEGPYYQRYAMYPFLVFAQGLHNARPELEIFEKDGRVLLNGVDALLQLSDAHGEFFPLNDGQKGMSYLAESIVSAVNIAYLMGGEDPRLLNIAEQQGRVLLDDAGFAVAAAIRDGKTEAFEKRSVNLSDGADGTEGGVAILRSGDEELTLVFKYAAQGLSHGHYDKLSFSLYERGDEVLQDYGLARFVNIGQKGGGNYLPENSSWAKQTIAHNTITINGESHFGGKYEVGSQHHSELHFYDDSDDAVQVVSAIEDNAYPGTRLQRTMAMIREEGFEKPFVLDVVKVRSERENTYDLPFYYLGQVLEVNFDYESETPFEVLGEANGYQHLYVEGVGRPGSDITQFAWMNNNRFYTLTSVADAADELLFTRIGANDPDFNLRREAAFMIRRRDTADTVFVTLIEPHGSYSPVSEVPLNSNSTIASLQIAYHDDEYTAVALETKSGATKLFVIANTDPTKSAQHELTLDGRNYQWSGPWLYTEL